jgi:hypothetical protein
MFIMLLRLCYSVCNQQHMGAQQLPQSERWQVGGLLGVLSKTFVPTTHKRR